MVTDKIIRSFDWNANTVLTQIFVNLENGHTRLHNMKNASVLDALHEIKKQNTSKIEIVRW